MKTTSIRMSLLCLFIAAAAGCAQEPSDGEEPAPEVVSESVLLVVLDATRSDSLESMPQVMSLAEQYEGWAGPSVSASHITPAGLIGILQGVATDPTAIMPAPRHTSLSVELRDAGYATRYAVSNAHVAWQAWHRGYQEVFDAETDDAAVLEATADWIVAADGPTFVTAMVLGPHLPYTSSEQCFGLTDQLAYAGLVTADLPKELRAAVRPCYDEELSTLDDELAPVLELALQRGWSTIVVSDHGEDLWDSENPDFGHNRTLNSQENMGVYVSWNTPEPEGTWAIARDVPHLLGMDRGLDAFAPADMTTTACEDGGISPAVATWNPAEERFEHLTEAEAVEGGVFWPSCDGAALESNRYVEPPATQWVLLRALGYMQ